MKKFNKILSLSVIAAGTAFFIKVFGNKNQHHGKNSKKNSNQNLKESDVINETDKQSNSETRKQKMFKDLGMTKNQKKRYEASLKSVINDWEIENPNIPVDNEYLLSEEDKSLNTVLNEVQYGMYRDWTKKYMN